MEDDRSSLVLVVLLMFFCILWLDAPFFLRTITYV